MLSRVHVVVSGRVQGVAFRYYAEKWATSLGVTGWVRNLDDGRVEAVAEGEREVLDRFVNLMRAGPRAARVEDAEVDWQDYRGEFPEFRISFFGD